MPATQQLWPNEPFTVGKVFEMNDRRGVVVGVCKASRTFQTFPIVYTRFQPGGAVCAHRAEVLVVCVGPSAGRTFARRSLCRESKSKRGLSALTHEQFIWKTIWYYMSARAFR